MASSEEKSSSRSGLGWLPKLILWAAVIGFGYVYLSSVDREGSGTTASSLLDSIAKLSPVSLPGFSDKEESAAKSTEVAQADDTPKTEATAQPVAQSGSAAKPTESTETPRVAEAPKPAPQPPVSYAAAALKVPSEPAPASAAQVPAERPAPAPAKPEVSITVEPPASPPVALAPSEPAPAPVAPQPGPESLPPAMSAPSAPTLSKPAPLAQMPGDEWSAQYEQQRAEMMAQYEAMRREADERMRQHWEQMRRTMPMPAMPYGYPGAYAPGPSYAPGYVPGVYGPPVP
ncbi:MAG: hypothetical protein ACUVT0_02315 [Thermochromatium sp.]